MDPGAVVDQGVGPGGRRTAVTPRALAPVGLLLDEALNLFFGQIRLVERVVEHAHDVGLHRGIVDVRQPERVCRLGVGARRNVFGGSLGKTYRYRNFFPVADELDGYAFPGGDGTHQDG